MLANITFALNGSRDATVCVDVPEAEAYLVLVNEVCDHDDTLLEARLADNEAVVIDTFDMGEWCPDENRFEPCRYEFAVIADPDWAAGYRGLNPFVVWKREIDGSEAMRTVLDLEEGKRFVYDEKPSRREVEAMEAAFGYDMPF